MYYTNLLFLLIIIFLSGCASVPSEESSEGTSETVSSASAVSKSAAVDELMQYREAITLLNENELDQAENLFLTIASSHPELAGPWANLGLIYIKKENYNKAKKYLDKSLKQNEKLPQALNLSGFAEQQRGNIKQAKEFYLRAISVKNNYANAHYNIALLYDTYYQDLPSAILHYKHYLQYSDEEDIKTRDWIKQLEAVVEREKK